MTAERSTYNMRVYHKVYSLSFLHHDGIRYTSILDDKGNNIEDLNTIKDILYIYHKHF